MRVILLVDGGGYPQYLWYYVLFLQVHFRCHLLAHLFRSVTNAGRFSLGSKKQAFVSKLELDWYNDLISYQT